MQDLMKCLMQFWHSLAKDSLLCFRRCLILFVFILQWLEDCKRTFGTDDGIHGTNTDAQVGVCHLRVSGYEIKKHLLHKNSIICREIKNVWKAFHFSYHPIFWKLGFSWSSSLIKRAVFNKSWQPVLGSRLNNTE